MAKMKKMTDKTVKDLAKPIKDSKSKSSSSGQPDMPKKVRGKKAC